MTLQELWKQYQDYTKEVSTNLRVLGFGVIGISWVFKGEDLTFPLAIRWALLLAVAYFLLDMLQYFITALIYRFWLYKEEDNRINAGESIDGEVDKPRWLDNFAFIAWCVKFPVLFFSYLAVSIHLLRLF